MSLSHDIASRSGHVKLWRDELRATPVARCWQFHSYTNSRSALDLSSHDGRLLSFLFLVQVFTRLQFKSRISGHSFFLSRRRRMLSLPAKALAAMPIMLTIYNGWEKRTMRNQVFWDVTPCRLANIYWCFEWTQCFHIWRQAGSSSSRDITSQKTWLFSNSTASTSNLAKNRQYL